MPLEPATALVLRVAPWSEASLVATLFTREFGKVRGVAKGARRPKGPFEAALDVLAVCKVVFLRKSSEALDLLTEAKLQRRFRMQGRELAGLYAGYYVAELLAELTDDYDPHPELFDAAVATLARLAGESQVACREVARREAAGRVMRFELQALHLLGHLPALEHCVECNAAIAGTGRVAFGWASGGVLCWQCRPGKRQVISLSPAAWQELRRLAPPAANGSAREHEELAPLARNEHAELRRVMNQYISGLVGHELRLMRYLTEV